MINLSRSPLAVCLVVIVLGGVTGPPAAAQGRPGSGAFIPDRGPAFGPGRPVQRLPAAAPAVPDGVLANTNLEAERDAFVSSEHRDTNYGSERYLYVGDRPGYGATRSFVWFETEQLAQDQAVTKALLRLYLREAGPSGDAEREVLVRRVDESWDEDEITWHRFPDYRDRREDGTGVGTRSDRYEWDVTRLVQRWRWPKRPWQDTHRDNHGLYVQGYESDGSYREFDSSEGSKEPELSITHATDIRPPEAALNRDLVPLYSSKPDPDNPSTTLVRLEWSGEDPDPATGIDYFRLYAQRNAEPWFVVGDTLRESTAGWFRGENGKRFGFRVHAVDMAGNVEPDSPAEVQTLVDLSPPVTSVRPLPAYVPGRFTLSWSGYDEPAGPDIYASGIARYNVYYSINGGAWGALFTDVTYTSGTLEPLQGLTYEFQAQAVDLARNFEPRGQAEARTHVDGLAPIVRFGPITGVDRRAFTVSWDGVDPGGSGIESYDIQYRRDLEPWTDWAIETQGRQLAFSGEPSHVYGFRGRARDAAGNVGVYPVLPQLSVGVLDRDVLRYSGYLPVMPQRQ